MSSAKIVVAIAAIALVATAGLYSTIVFQEMVDAVNERMPQGEQFNPLWWYWPKSQKLMVEYRRLYPDRTLVGKYKISVAAGIMSLFALAWAIGFFRW
jgi:hypothetical protein